MNEGPASLASMTFSVVGAGRVGVSLAHWAAARGASISQVASRSTDSAQVLADSLGGRLAHLESLSTAQEDFLLIAVDDAALEAVAETLALRKQAAVVMHTAGRVDSSVLAPLRNRGSAIGSLHPLKAFTKPLLDAAEGRGVVFALDGDSQAQDLACRLTEAWEAIAVEVPPASRAIYHLAATLSAGGVVTLLASCSNLASRLGLPPAVVRGYLRLAQDAVRQAGETQDIASAITGPVARGDLDGFRAQVALLRNIDPELADLVDLLARQTLRLRKETL